MAEVPHGPHNPVATPKQFAEGTPSSPMLDHSFTLQAVMELQKSVGQLVAKVDRLGDDTKTHGTKIDEIRHQVSFVKGAMWVAGATLAFLIIAGGWLVQGKLQAVFDAISKISG